MTRAYWRTVGGLLIEEFCAVRRSPGCGDRRLDGLIVRGRETRIAEPGERVDIRGESVIVVQAKARRLGMSLMGQAFFSPQLLAPFGPRAVHSVALCAQDDPVLRPLLEAHPGIEVIVMPDPTSFGALAI